MRKKIIYIFLSFCILISGVFAYNADAVWAEESIPLVYPANGIEELQKTFPSTRRQKPYGSCWAHAVAACADFDMVKNHGKPRTFDVSEIQLAYYTYHPGLDRLGNLNGDINKLEDAAKTHFLSVGGNSIYAMRTLAQWKGFTFEKNIPYSSAKDVIASGLKSSNAYRSDAAKLEKGYIVDLKNKPEDAKKAIMNYGAAVITYENEDHYYNSSTNSYRNPFDHATNHACAIVGWDDSYPADAFGYPASRNGAWLIRNSGTKKSTASHLGYFWMSYDDKSLAECAYVLDFMPPDRYDHNYQHDGTASTGNIKAETAANVFTARNMNSVGSETLDAVMLSFDDEIGVKYQIDIYTNLKNGKDPESGYHHSYATTTGCLNHAGMYTIPLKEKVYLAKGETFSVVVTSLNGKLNFDCERSVDRTYEDGTPRFKGVAHADAGESFYKRKHTDNSWKDCAADNLKNYGNMCIKAMTNDSGVKKYNITYKLDGESINDNPTSYFSTTKDTVLQAPVKEGYRFLGWYTDSSYNNPITTLNGALGSNLKLYAKWEEEPTVAPIVTPQKVVQKKVKKASPQYVTVSWNKLKGTTYYQVSKTKKKNGVNVVVKKAKGESVKVKAAKGQTYWYKVRAYHIVNGKKIKGPWSAPKKYKL